MLKERGYKCTLGVSNVSFGLPERDVINSAFYTAALFAGLDLAIINPESEAMMNAYRSYMALSANDEGCQRYVEYISGKTSAPVVEKAEKSDTPLGELIEKGLKSEAKAKTEALLSTRDALDIINNEIIPALDRVGRGFEEKRIYLPGLLMSAEAANAAFSVIRERTPVSGTDNGRSIVLATVKGDIHDIGKNIVKLIFESYGYKVIDLGRDVSKECILEALKTSGAELLGLSALMTTTLPAMEETVALVKKELPRVKIIVGGAVLTGTYAKKIGADFYAPDAISAVRYVDEINKA
jgi:5-methyltetrahydrofolate--homocysteine methyltransferase